MKKICQCLAVLIVCLLIIPASSIKAEPKTNTLELFLDDAFVIVNGKKSSVLESQPFIYNQRMYSPFLLLSEFIGFRGEYNTEEKSITLINSKTTLIMKYNFLTVTVNGKEVQVDAPYLIRYGRSVMPVRFICETFGATVSWDPVLHKATIVYEVSEEVLDIVCTTKINEKTYKILEIEHSSKTVNMYLFDETYKPILDRNSNQITFLPGEPDFDKKLSNCINALFVNKIEIKSGSRFFFQIQTGHIGDWEMVLGIDYTGPSAFDYKKYEIHELDETFSKNAIVGEFTVTTQESDSYTGFRYSPNLYKKWYQISINGKSRIKNKSPYYSYVRSK